MAIYSLNVATVGKSTHAPGTAGAHLRYIGRHDAVRDIQAEHMPEDPQQARTWMDNYEAGVRKNARILTKIRIALPRELDERQRSALLRETLGDLTGGRVPWFAAIHDRGKDAHNPHAHVALVDRDIDTGKRVLMLSDGPRERRKAGLEENGVEAVRQHWEHKANTALERAGHGARIDRRSLEAQGIDRTPQLHIGPQAQQIDDAVHRPESRRVPDPTPDNPDRVIDYPAIDQGRTRNERCAEIIDLNLERAARSRHFESRVWAQFERDQRRKDKPVEREIVAAARERTAEERELRRQYAAQLKEVRARQRAEARLAQDWLKQRHTVEIHRLRQHQTEEKDDMRRQQGRPMARFFAAVDITGRTRSKREAARKALARKHMRERRELGARLRRERGETRESVKARYRPERDRVIRERNRALAQMRQRHAAAQEAEDARLQDRARQRERARQVVRQQIADYKRMQKDRAREDDQRQATGEAETQLRRDWRNTDRPRAETSQDNRGDGDAAPKRRRGRKRERGPRSR